MPPGEAKNLADVVAMIRISDKQLNLSRRHFACWSDIICNVSPSLVGAIATGVDPRKAGIAFCLRDCYTLIILLVLMVQKLDHEA